MDKVKNRVISFIPYVVIAFLSTGILFRELGSDGDELWNYNFARCVCNGLRPYSDFSMVQTPLSAYFAGIILVVFGDYLFVYRLTGVVLMLATFGLMYKICNKLLKTKTIAFVATVFAMLLAQSTWLYNYNTLNLFIIIILICICIKENEKSEESGLGNEVLFGLVIGITPLLKQTTGLMLMLANLFLAIMDYKKYGKKLKNVITRVLVSGVPCLIYLSYLIVSEQWTYFYEYTIVGIKYFTHRYSIIKLMTSSFIGALLVISVLLMLIYVIKKLIKEKDDNKRRLTLQLLLFSMAGMIVAYPLTDVVHFTLAALPFVICLCCCIGEIKISGRDSLICNGVAIFLVVCSTSILFPSLDGLKECKLKHFELIPIDGQMENNIEIIDEYILQREENGQKVLVTSEAASVYMIPLDKYNKNYDMLLLGNLGASDIDDLLNVEDGTLFLLLKDNSQLNWQGHFELIEYIQDNYECVGEIVNYDVYRAIKE